MNNDQLRIKKYQLTEGYKQTELGVIPEEWDVISIEELGDVIRGASPRPKGDKRYYGGNIPRLMVEDVTRDEKFVTPSVDFLTEEGAKRSRPCSKGTLTLVCSGTVGIPSFLAIDACIHDGFLALVNVKEQVDSDFLYHFLRTQQSQFNNSATHGGVFTNLTTEIFRNFRIPLPQDKKEQRLIAQALSDVDALIAAMDKLIAKKRNLKTATMQQLLTGKKRLPGFGEGQGYKQTEVGIIPEDWSVVTLAEIGQSLIGLTYKPENIRDYGTLVLRSSNIQNDRLAYEDNVYVDSSLPLPARVIVEKGDILICVRNGSRQLIGKCALIDSVVVGCAFGAFMSVFRTKLSGFVFYQFQSALIKKQINEIMGATINQITNKDMAAFQIPLPSLEAEQHAIATVLSDMDAEIAALESRLAKTQALKQGMMQELLTGRIRLKIET